jgi:hypothetical protein
MYFKRLKTDSIVGVKGHWYMYIDNKEHVIYEDIYDGNRLLRKNNRDSVVLIYDLIKYPEFRHRPFWGHNTPYGMQYEFRYILENLDSYKIVRMNDTIVNEQNCFQLMVILKDKMTMPGFAVNLEDKKGQVSTNIYCIDKSTYYPLMMKGESFSLANTDPKIFMEQYYYDIKFNLIIDEDFCFNTSLDKLTGFTLREMKPE